MAVSSQNGRAEAIGKPRRRVWAVYNQATRLSNRITHSDFSMHRRLLLTVCVWGGLLAATGRSQAPENGPVAGFRSSIQATGTGTVPLKPTILRLSIPIKVVSDTAWDATENLRTVRRSIVERATEMGPIEGSLQVFGFYCGQEQPSTISSIRGDVSKTKFEARCFVVADFPLREGEDQEETLGLSQAQLEQLASLLPQAEPGRRSYSVSTLASGLTSQQLENPLALFVAKVSAEDQAKAFKQAYESAEAQVQATLDALGIEATSISISQSPSYSSIRPMNPLESVLDGNRMDEVTGVYVDSVALTVRLVVIGQFNDSH